MSNSQYEIITKFAAALEELDIQSGESEWGKPTSKIDNKMPVESGESEWGRSNVFQYSDEDLLKLIAEDPIGVLSDLMIQHNPNYQKVEILLPMAKGVMNWFEKANWLPEKNSILYKEFQYVLQLLDKLK